MAASIEISADARLRSFIERIERLHEERAALAKDIAEVFSEAKGTGFDPKIMRLIIRERAMDADDRDEQESLLSIYRKALGMLPLFERASHAHVREAAE